MRKAAFTLTELMVTVAIMSILVAVAIPSYSRMRCKADWSELQSSLADIALRMENYRSNHGVYPASGDWSLLGFVGEPEVGIHYQAFISSTDTSYVIAMKDTKKPINCSGAAGFENDIWAKTNTSPKIYHVSNSVDKTTEALPSGYSLP